MSEGVIKLEDIGRAEKFAKKRIDFIHDRFASSLKSQNINEIHVKYHDGRENIIRASSFTKKIEIAPYYADEKTSPADHYVQMCTLALVAGLPVAPTVKINDKEVSVIDISEGGIYFDKAMATKLDPNVKNKTKLAPEVLRHPSFRQFLNIPLEEIEAEANKLAKLAAENNLALPGDDPMNLLVLPDGRWRVDLLDPDLLRQYDQINRKYINKAKRQIPDWMDSAEYKPKKFNKIMVKQFMNYIKTIRANIPSV